MFEQIRKNWDDSPLNKKLILVFGILLVLAIFIGGAYWTLREDYQVLFSDLNSQDASVMVDELDRLKVPYELADNGTTILVERSLVYKTRLKLMGKGLNLNGSVGFEIFNNSEFGMTEFSQKVNYQRALQGELVRTIMAFDEIKSARVHIVMPESGLFKHENAKPKASVSIVMKDDNALSHEQILGIQRLVAASVPEINPEAVTVIDQKGVALTKQSVLPESEAALPERLDMKRQLEDYMTRKIVNVVDRAVGPGKAIVSVDVSINYDQIKVTKDDIVPLPATEGQDVGAVTRKKETYQSDDNFNDISVTQNKSGTNIGNGNSSTEAEFANSRRVEQVLSSPGNISKLTVGVLLPDTTDQVKIAKLKEMIGMVAGINTARGDGLAVYAVDLPVSDNAIKPNGKPMDGLASNSEALRSGKTVVDSHTSHLDTTIYTLGVLFLFILIIFLVLPKWSRAAQPKRLSPEERARFLDEIRRWTNQAGSV